MHSGLFVCFVKPVNHHNALIFGIRMNALPCWEIGTSVDAGREDNSNGCLFTIQLQTCARQGYKVHSICDNVFSTFQSVLIMANQTQPLFQCIPHIVLSMYLTCTIRPSLRSFPIFYNNLFIWSVINMV